MLTDRQTLTAWVLSAALGGDRPLLSVTGWVQSRWTLLHETTFWQVINHVTDSIGQFCILVKKVLLLILNL